MMQRAIFLSFCLLLCVSFCCLGCNARSTLITGSVSYDEDGSPMGFGQIAFSNNTSEFIGEIQPDGTYKTGGIKEVDGIPDGIYKVYFKQTEEVIPPDFVKKIPPKEIPRIAAEFTSVNSTPLTFEVKRGGTTTFNIKVKKP
jgi:hypothetical protein